MLITDSFVFIHLTKTGGTFVREAIRSVYGLCSVRTLNTLGSLQSMPPAPFFFRTPTKHLRAEKIPRVFRELPVVSVLCDPLRRYEAQFHWANWLHYRQQFPGITELPGFPNIRFVDFVMAANEHLWLTGRVAETMRRQGIGWQTALFLYWYCSGKYLDEIAAGIQVDVEGIVANLLVSRFLRNARLSWDVADLLANVATAEQLTQLRSLPPLRRVHHRVDRDRKQCESPTTNEFSGQQQLVDTPLRVKRGGPHLREFVREKEKLLVGVIERLGLWSELDDRLI